ncbi:MAG: hypothetical protein KAI47_28100, partial [Deltaproteobacteria bacterium]|nr:hypothetical protein [Deltaproteobacteria bacterium]
YQLNARLGQWALGWVLAGSVLEGIPSVRTRDHFYDPTSRHGLADPRPLVGSLWEVLSMLEGGDSLNALLTGTGFDFTGRSALAWMRAKDNPSSLSRFRRELRLSATAQDPSMRRQHLARALLALGGILHLLQDLASPTHVRNDYARGHLQKLGSSLFSWGSAYERYVLVRYGRVGIPDYLGPDIRRPRVDDYFSNAKRWDGLANITHVSHFSPGTLPPPLHLLSSTTSEDAYRRLTKKLRYAKPALGPIDLRCASEGTCYQRGPHGRKLAYTITRRQKLRFFLDYRCHAAAARHLLPLAVGFSRGLIDHLLRGKITLSLNRAKRTVSIKSLAPALTAARIQILREDLKGQRHTVLDRRLGRTTANARLVTVTLPNAPTRSVIAVLTGQDGAADPIVAITTRPWLETPTALATPTSSQPATPTSSQPATPTSSQPATPTSSQPATRVSSQLPATSKPPASVPKKKLSSPLSKPATKTKSVGKPATAPVKHTH